MAMEKHFIQEGIIRSEIESFLRHELNRAGYSGINIQKTPLATRVILYVEKPPLVIGKKGKRINQLTTTLKEKYGVENPSIDVQRIEQPSLDPNIIARRIAVALERGMNRRRVAYKALRAVMGSGARGVEIILAGKIIGKGGRARVEKYAYGYMKKSGDSTKLVSVGRIQAYLKAGVIGVTVKIVPPNVIFPDQISVLKPSEPAEATSVVSSPVAASEAVAEGVLTAEASEKKASRKKSEKKAEKKSSEGSKEAKLRKKKPVAEKSEKTPEETHTEDKSRTVE